MESAMHSPNTAIFRFYEELNDFLPPARRKKDVVYRFSGSPSVKDAIEALGVPHTEVDLVLVNGRSVDFGYRLSAGYRIAVYPVFESFDISPVIRLRPAPLRKTSFILDVQLGKLARILRLLGFDTLYSDAFTHGEMIRTASEEGRIILTRDLALLKRRAVTRGYWVRSSDPDAQIREVLLRFDLTSSARPFTRCLECNGTVCPVEKERIRDRLEPKTALYYDEFNQCGECGRIYWKGSHHRKMEARVRRWLGGE